MADDLEKAVVRFVGRHRAQSWCVWDAPNRREANWAKAPMRATAQLTTGAHFLVVGLAAFGTDESPPAVKKAMSSPGYSTAGDGLAERHYDRGILGEGHHVGTSGVCRPQGLRVRRDAPPLWRPSTRASAHTPMRTPARMFPQPAVGVVDERNIHQWLGLGDQASLPAREPGSQR